MVADLTDEFVSFVRATEPRLRRALVAVWGPDLGQEASAEALLYAWRNWPRVRGLENPAGYLYTVGKRSVRPSRLPLIGRDAVWSEPWVEPNLARGLRSLTKNQRTCVVLHHSFAWTYEEIGELLGVSVSTVRNHIRRSMGKLRAALEVTIHE